MAIMPTALMPPTLTLFGMATLQIYGKSFYFNASIVFTLKSKDTGGFTSNTFMRSQPFSGEHLSC